MTFRLAFVVLLVVRVHVFDRVQFAAVEDFFQGLGFRVVGNRAWVFSGCKSCKIASVSRRSMELMIWTQLIEVL